MKTCIKLLWAKTLLCSVLFLFSIQAQAQIEAPQLICISNDTIVWNLPTVTCGPINSYDIFASQNVGGPYILLASIADITQTSFYHSGANSSITPWYYYIQTNANCPGINPLQSDTLDSPDPETPIFDAISVLGSSSEITWFQSSSPETVGYIIYRELNGTFIPIDTVFGGSITSYIDNTAQADQQSEEYTIIAFDACFNTSLFNTNTHATIFMDVDVDRCQRTASLNWNRYQNWPLGVEEYSVLVSINSAQETVYTSTDSSTVNALIENLNDGDQVCIRVAADRVGGGRLAYSNQQCFVLDVVQPMADSYIRRVTTLPTGTIQIDWRWDSRAELISAELNRSEDNNGFVVEQNLSPINLAAFNTTLDSFLTADQFYYDYYLETEDSCNVINQSSRGRSILLQGEAQRFSNTLNWSSYQTDFGSLVQYNVYRITSTGNVAISSSNLGSEFHLDELNLNFPEDQNACYVVEAIAQMNYPDGFSEQQSSFSNIICLEQQPSVQIPNAFVPSGVNDRFRPLLTFSEGATGSIKIFDRYGALVFESSDLNQGWNGKNTKGNDMRQGVYVYSINITSSTGQQQEFNGSVMLLR